MTRWIPTRVPKGLIVAAIVGALVAALGAVLTIVSVNGSIAEEL